jgi:urease accessory protein
VSANYLCLLLADGRLPSGAHTQSAGVEPALLGGMDLAQLPDYLLARLETVTETEAATAVVARFAWTLSSPAPVTALQAIDWAWRVRTLSDAQRSASDQLGRSYLRLSRAVWDLSGLSDRLWCRPVVVGVTAAAAGLDAPQTARLVAYDDVQTVIAAALKLRPFDPATGVAWAAAAAPAVERLVERVAASTTASDIPARAAPQLEEWVQRHSKAERRLFRA